MPEYEIPLSSIYDEGHAKQVEIRTGEGHVSRRFDIVDRTGETPHRFGGVVER